MKCASCGSYNTTIDSGPLLVKVEGEDEETFRPLTEEEEKRLGQAEFPEGEGDHEGDDSDDEDGWETTEEDPDDDPPELQEEELD